MRFFLEKPASAYVVVREVENKHSYWLDKVRPPTPWGPGFANSFEWSTRDVIDQLPLPRPRLYDLGVTVRVGSKDPLDRETVAPVILYHSKLPGSISGYECAVKTTATARLAFSVERPDGTPVKPPPVPSAIEEWQMGIPLRVRWDASRAEPGEYRLKAKGLVQENLKEFKKEIRFFHQPKIP
jgi:hypothetical protein